MAKSTALVPYDIPQIEDTDLVVDRVSKLLWKAKEEGLIALKDMDDHHIRSAALMLIGMGYQTYRAPDELKVRWLTAFRIEWERRMQVRRREQRSGR